MKDYSNANAAVHLKVFLVMVHITVRLLGLSSKYILLHSTIHTYVTYMHDTCILLVIEYQYFIDLRIIIKRC